MTLSLHTLKPAHGARTKTFRIGRGHGSGRGKTAGKGTKGQKSRTGGKKGLQLKGMKQMLLSFPKTRGFQSRIPKARAISFAQLESFPAGTSITIESLRGKGLMMRRDITAKIVGTGPAKKAYKVSGIAVSAPAKAAIEAAGGTVS